jgi:hypothetical protein
VEGAEKLALLGLLAVLASASYFLIEPARYAPVSRKFVFSSAATATMFLIIAGAIGPRLIPAQISDPRIASLQKYESLTGMERTGTCYLEDWTTNKHSECFSYNDRKQVALVWGDSLANQYVYGWKGAAPESVALLQANAAGCFPTFNPIFKQFEFCDALADRVRSFVAANHPSLLIISADWVGYSKRIGGGPMISNLKQTIAAAGVPVVVIGPSVQFKGRLPSILIRSYAQGGSLPASADVTIAGLSELDREMKSAFSIIEGVTYVSAMDAVCPNRVCPLLIDGDAPLTWDHGHLTDEGSNYAADKMAPAIFSQRVASPR